MVRSHLLIIDCMYRVPDSWYNNSIPARCALRFVASRGLGVFNTHQGRITFPRGLPPTPIRACQYPKALILSLVLFKKTCREDWSSLFSVDFS